MAKPLLWKDMSPEERDELRERLDKAGVPKLKTGQKQKRESLKDFIRKKYPDIYRKYLREKYLRKFDST